MADLTHRHTVKPGQKGPAWHAALMVRSAVGSDSGHAMSPVLCGMLAIAAAAWLAPLELVPTSEGIGAAMLL